MTVESNWRNGPTSDSRVLAPTPRAPWASKPCELYKYHAPTPTLTEGHHVHPVFLQNRLYGNIVDNQLKYLCANCHDSVHEWLYWLLGNRRNEPVVGRLAKEEAVRTYDWYMSELERMGRDYVGL